MIDAGLKKMRNERIYTVLRLQHVIPIIVSLALTCAATIVLASEEAIGNEGAPAAVANVRTGFSDEGQVQADKGTESSFDGSIEEQRRLISEFLLGWVQAWQNSAGPAGVFGPFATYYADTFFSDSDDRKKWLDSKARTNRDKNWIQVQLEDVEIVSSPDSDYAVVRFLQKYASSNYSDSSNKILILQRGKEGWKIVTERAK